MDAENLTTPVYYFINDTFSNHTKIRVKTRTSTEIPIWLIPCYSVILVIAVVGNLLVASTLFQNRRMRTITNVFLVNLAISDMLLGVLCMPITLAGTYLRHFMFGELVCKFIQFAQAASVAVSSWTLVAISCERYYAICHPLRSRTWQTINHAYKIIGSIWLSSIICMAPIAIFSQLIPTSRQGLRKCREQWPQQAVCYERFYNIFLDLTLLVFPLLILCVAYILITRTLYMGIKDEKALIFGNKSNNNSNGYHTRQGAICSAADGVINDETLQKIKTTETNSKERKFLTSTGMESKETVMGSVSIKAETRIEMKDLEKQAMQQTQSTGQPKCDVDTQLNDTGKSNETEAARETFPTTPATSASLKHSNSLDGKRSQLYCMRSSSVKSVNRNGVFARGKKQEAATSSCLSLNAIPHFNIKNQYKDHQSLNQKQQLSEVCQRQQITDFCEKLTSTASLRTTESALRRSNLAKNLESKKRVVKMLFVLVLEFFICWTPLYVINTVAMFIGPAIYEYVDYTTISFFHLLAYSSSCCNPITYCFMNAGFRRAFADTFKEIHLNGGSFWHTNSKASTNLRVAGNSIALANNCTVVTANTVLESPRL